MSKNIVIQEGGTGKQLTVDKLKTNLVGGGTCLWVPEDEKQLGTKYISENGTYKASDEGLYGYSEVTVSGVGSVTGKDPDTGEDVTVTKDPDTGEIVETVVATEIRITNEPTKTTYTNGETIDFSGLVVHAYSSTGRDIGAIPFNELVFPVTTADASAQGDEWTDGHGLNAMMIYYTPKPYVDSQGREEIVYVGQVLGANGSGEPSSYGSGYSPATMLMTRYNNQNYAMRVTGDDQANMFSYKEDDGSHKSYGWSLSGGSSAHPTTGRFMSVSFEDYLTNLPNSSVDPVAADPTNLHAMQSVPVQWTQPGGDGTVLETSFSINVNSAA